jgi:hypothetical protein
MIGPNLTRRRFALATGGLFGANVRLASGATIAARDGMARIQASAGVLAPTSTVDGFKAGNPDITVKGIATTAMATMDVLKQAARRAADWRAAGRRLKGPGLTSDGPGRHGLQG